MDNTNAMNETGSAPALAAPPMFAAPVCPEIGTWGYDIQADMMLWSDDLYDLYDVDRAFVPTLKSMLGLCMPGGQSADKALSAAVSQGTDFDIEYPVLLKCGATRWLRTEGSVHSRNGKPQRIVGNTRDIAADVAEQAGFGSAAELVSQAAAPGPSVLGEMLQRAEVVAAASGREFAILCFTGIRGTAHSRIKPRGDVLVRELIERLTPVVNDFGVLVQLSGNSLVILAEKVKDTPELSRLCGRLKAELRKPIVSPFDEIRATFRLDVFRGTGHAETLPASRPVCMAVPCDAGHRPVRSGGAGQTGNTHLQLIVNNPANEPSPDTERR
jgi:hypothetical protein